MSRAQDTLDALWTVLEGNAIWAGLMAGGTKYKFAEHDLLRKLDYELAWCPIFVLAPEAQGSQWPPARRDRGDGLAEIFAVRMEGATAGQVLAPCLALAEAARNAFAAALDARGALTALLVDEIDYAGLAYELTPNKNSVVETWKFQVTLNVRFRVS